MEITSKSKSSKKKQPKKKGTNSNIKPLANSKLSQFPRLLDGNELFLYDKKGQLIDDFNDLADVEDHVRENLEEEVFYLYRLVPYAIVKNVDVKIEIV